VFEADFLDCSHGFRPGRNPHHALQALRVQIVTKKVGQVFEADIRSYFTRINHHKHIDRLTTFEREQPRSDRNVWG
jgi:retron-type reverse transcriptase